ncbi:MAG TPA: L-glutamate gamma-semialdehyde dehydrogenase, partial [Longimicrobiales bacterium]|nr:L-glutamate gamma-semialdehyde dehydrogenase [Longimicrobiales bacterium]
MNGIVKVPPPRNEPVFSYAPGTPERAALKKMLTEMSGKQIDIPLIIGGEEIRTGDTLDVVMPHNHGHVLAKAHKAGPDEVKKAIAAAMDAHHEWSTMRWEDRASIFLKAADLLAGPYRQILNASTMLCQSKTAHQAEIDAAAEMVDFFRMNVHFAEKIYGEQPLSDPGMWNRSQYRALEGFVYAITPFNFTSIGGNLPSAPAIMGNTVVWKPARTAMLSNYYMAKLFQEAGVPAGVINFITGNSSAITDELLSHPDFGGVHFTGSTGVFNSFWKTIGASVGSYKSYPRIVGETGGKDFIIAHPSADPEALTTAILRGAFEYQGQKCSAASRIYLPQSVWGQIKDTLIEETDNISMGDVADFSNFMGAVIDRTAFDKIKAYIDRARESSDAEIVAGGECDDSVGYFIRPTIILAKTAKYESMCEEIFGPVVTVYVYEDKEWSETLKVLDATSPYALTGAVFSQDRRAIREAMDALRNAAGNFYINDKPTGAVVGQQPFGGSRGSGTNDKAGSVLN